MFLCVCVCPHTLSQSQKFVLNCFSDSESVGLNLGHLCVKLCRIFRFVSVSDVCHVGVPASPVPIKARRGLSPPSLTLRYDDGGCRVLSEMSP